MGALAAGPAAALTITYTKIADTDTPVPGGSGNFRNFLASPPSISGGRVAFVGSDASNADGIYTKGPGALAVVADESTPVPGGSGSFQTFAGPPSISGDSVVFLGFGASVGGVYTSASGSLAVVADTNTPVPGGGNFLFFDGKPSIGRSGVAFNGTGELGLGGGGIYTDATGPLTVVADMNTPVPEAADNFETFFSSPSIGGADVVFAASWGAEAGNRVDGIYASTGGSLAVVADSNTPVPGDSGHFEFFDGIPSIDAGSVAFFASSVSLAGDRTRGIYTTATGSLSVVADTNTPVPGGTGTFAFFDLNPSISGGRVAFVGLGESTAGLYIAIRGVLFKVIAEGDSLNGSTVSSLSFDSLGRTGLSGNQLAFRAGLADGRSGIFVATIPEPSTALLLGLGIVGLAARTNQRARMLPEPRSGRVSRPGPPQGR